MKDYGIAKALHHDYEVAMAVVQALILLPLLAIPGEDGLRAVNAVVRGFT